jgi:glycosyltransferase involved in cell wall biosynthesis
MMIDPPSQPLPPIAVVMTVRNDPHGCAVTLESLLGQSCTPAEIIVVDGGSKDTTANVVREFAARCDRVRLIEAPGANIAAGRNIGIAAAQSEIIATIDAGCRAEETWLAQLTASFSLNPEIRMVGGFYRIEPRSLLEAVVGLATMRGQLDDVDPETFNPSARSMAFAKATWAAAGGFPEWLRFSEDTLFDHRIRAMGIRPEFAPAAIVHWRPRTSLRSIARQFYNYGTGRGQTRIGAADFLYNLRNLGIMIALAALSCVEARLSPLLLAALLYFYVWAFHAKARRIAIRLHRPSAYWLALIVTWIVLASNTLGFVVGTVQAWLAPRQYMDRLRAYMTGQPRTAGATP